MSPKSHPDTLRTQNWPGPGAYTAEKRSMGWLKVSILFSFMAFPSLVLAIPLMKCPSGNLGVEKQANLLHKVALLGEDGRSTIHKYAKDEGFSVSQLEHDFSGVGTLWCAGTAGTAQLTASNDVITTSAHAFYLDDCRPVVTNGKPCQFQLDGSDEKHDLYLDLNNLENSPDPRNARIKCPRDNPDWAVIKLKKPIENAAFFSIKDHDVNTRRDQQITQVSFKRDHVNKKMTKLAQKCLARRPQFISSGIVILHDCDTEPGSSGGAQVTFENGKFYLFGIHMGGRSQVDSTAKVPGRKFKDYDGKENVNQSVPVGGAFLREIKRMRDLRLDLSN